MRPNQRLVDWRVTRVLVVLGIFAVAQGILRFAVAASSWGWIAILTGVFLLALSTRGPWDSESSGRNRSVLGFRARSPH